MGYYANQMVLELINKVTGKICEKKSEKINRKKVKKNESVKKVVEN